MTDDNHDYGKRTVPDRISEEQVLAALSTLGSSTARQLGKHMGVSHVTVGKRLSALLEKNAVRRGEDGRFTLVDSTFDFSSSSGPSPLQSQLSYHEMWDGVRVYYDPDEVVHDEEEGETICESPDGKWMVTFLASGKIDVAFPDGSLVTYDPVKKTKTAIGAPGGADIPPRQRRIIYHMTREEIDAQTNKMFADGVPLTDINQFRSEHGQSPIAR